MSSNPVPDNPAPSLRRPLLQPALSFTWDVLLFHRPTSGREAFGITLILAAIFLGSRRQ